MERRWPEAPFWRRRNETRCHMGELRSPARKFPIGD